MKPVPAGLAAALFAASIALPIGRVQAESLDPIGDLLGQVATKGEPLLLKPFALTATLYHMGVRGIHNRDSLGCKVVPMRTAAVDGVDVKRHSLLFIKETVGLPMPGGRLHDGYWYATDIGGGIHKGRIDLFTGQGSSSMAPMMHLNLATLTVSKVGEFSGCPTLNPSEPASFSAAPLTTTLIATPPSSSPSALDGQEREARQPMLTHVVASDVRQAGR